MDRKQKSKQSYTDRNSRKGIKYFKEKQKELLDLIRKLSSLINVFQTSESLAQIWERHLQVEEVIKQILERERPSLKNENVSRQLNLEKYINWLHENKAEFDGLEICSFENFDFGLKATKPIEEGSLILTIPSKIMMSVRNAKESELGQLIEQTPLKNMPNIILALYLLLEKNKPDSFWKPYIDVLPEKYTTILYYSSDELAELRPSPTFLPSLKLYQSIVRWYAYYYEIIHTMDLPILRKLQEIFTFENYRWAISTVMTRQNNIPLSESSVTAFIPLWDMCNHEHGTITTDFNRETARGECYALRDFAAGDQIFIFYGARPNCDLFLHNGFVYPGNQHDKLSLPFGISSNDPCRGARLVLLKKLGLADVANYNLYQPPSPVSPELLAFIRIFNMNEEELKKVGSDEDMVWYLVSPSDENTRTVEPDIDRRAYNYLLIRCRLIKASYKMESSVNEPLSAHKKNVKMLKECEVQILDGAIEYLNNVLEKLPTVCK